MLSAGKERIGHTSWEGAGRQYLSPRESPHSSAWTSKAMPLCPGKLARKRQLPKAGLCPPRGQPPSLSCAGAQPPRAAPKAAPGLRRRPAPPRPAHAAAQAAALIRGGQVNSSSRSWMNNEWSREGKPRARNKPSCSQPAAPSPSLRPSWATFPAPRSRWELGTPRVPGPDSPRPPRS